MNDVIKDGAYIHNPENKLKIKEVFVFISEDDEGNEGVCGFVNNGIFMPMVCADVARMESLRSKAKELAAMRGLTGKSIKLIRLSVREELETITP